MSTGRIGWHELMTTDVEKAKSFYGELLGWGIEVYKPGEMDYPMISVNGGQHGGFAELPEQARKAGAPPHWLAHVIVESADEAASRAEASGGNVLVGPMSIPEVGRFAVIADPQGAVFSAFQAEGEAPTPEGVFLWDELLAIDIEAAKSFYGSVLGWTTEPMEMAGGSTYTLFKAGDQMVGGLMLKPEQAGPGPAAWMTYLATDDVDATAARAQKLGGSVLQPAFDVPTVGRIAVIADPTGAVVGLFKPEQR